MMMYISHYARMMSFQSAVGKEASQQYCIAFSIVILSAGGCSHFITGSYIFPFVYNRFLRYYEFVIFYV